MARVPDGWVFVANVSDPKFEDGKMTVDVSVDERELVMCRNCKYGEPDTNGAGEDMVMCMNTHNPIGYDNWLMPPEWYCADGERRNADEVD